MKKEIRKVIFKERTNIQHSWRRREDLIYCFAGIKEIPVIGKQVIRKTQDDKGTERKLTQINLRVQGRHSVSISLMHVNCQEVTKRVWTNEEGCRRKIGLC